MQGKKDLPTFNIRKIVKKNNLPGKNGEDAARYTPEHEHEKWLDGGTYTNPKKEKQSIIDQSVTEAILASKTYLDLKKQYFENKRKNQERRRLMEEEIQHMQREKSEASNQQLKIGTERHKLEDAVRVLKERISATRERNKQVRESLQYQMTNEEYLSNLIISMRFQAEYEHDINPDQMTYEELLELEEKIGQVSRGLPKDLLDKLEKRKIVVNTEDMCTVCFSTFEVGDTATTLFRCSHSFHYDCLATWLQKEKKCPVCKQQVTFPGQEQLFQ